LPDLSRPGDRRRAGERRRSIGFFIQRDDDGARFRCRMRALVKPPAQPGENVDRYAVEAIEGWRQDQRGGNERDGDRGTLTMRGIRCD